MRMTILASEILFCLVKPDLSLATVFPCYYDLVDVR